MVRYALLAIVVDYRDSSTLYVITGGGGVFKSRDGGMHWQEASHRLTNRSTKSLALDLNDPGLLYVGPQGGGIFRSLDGGESWSPINVGCSTAAFGLSPSILATPPPCTPAP